MQIIEIVRDAAAVGVWIDKGIFRTLGINAVAFFLACDFSMHTDINPYIYIFCKYQLNIFTRSLHLLCGICCAAWKCAKTRRRQNNGRYFRVHLRSCWHSSCCDPSSRYLSFWNSCGQSAKRPFGHLTQHSGSRAAISHGRTTKIDLPVKVGAFRVIES